MSDLDDKPWWQSRTLVGIAVVILAQLAKLAGYEIDQTALLNVVLELLTLLGAALAWWGRVRATQPIRRRAVRVAGPVPAVGAGVERVHGHPLEPVPTDPGRSAPDSPFEH